jgi:predicted esterase
MNILHEDAASGLSFRLREAVGQRAARLFLLHGVGGNETNLMTLADTINQRVELVFVRGPLVLGSEQYLSSMRLRQTKVASAFGGWSGPWQPPKRARRCLR